MGSVAPGRDRRSCEAQTTPAAMEKAAAMAIRWRYGGVSSSSISLVRRRTRVVGIRIEGARQDATHSIHGDATRKARAGQTIGDFDQDVDSPIRSARRRQNLKPNVQSASPAAASRPDSSEPTEQESRLPGRRRIGLDGVGGSGCRAVVNHRPRGRRRIGLDGESAFRRGLLILASSSRRGSRPTRLLRPPPW